jgi:hypothetical protein
MQVCVKLHAPTGLPPPPPRERTHVIQRIRGLVGHRAGLDTVVKRQILHCKKSNSARAGHGPSLYHVSYPEDVAY